MATLPRNSQPAQIMHCRILLSLTFFGIICPMAAMGQTKLDENGWTEWLTPDQVSKCVEELANKKLAIGVQAQTHKDKPWFRLQWGELQGINFSIRLSGNAKRVQEIKKGYPSEKWKSVAEHKIYDSGGFWWIQLWHSLAPANLDKDGWSSWMTPAEVGPAVDNFKKKFSPSKLEARTVAGNAQFRIRWMPPDGHGFSLRLSNNPKQIEELKAMHPTEKWRSVQEVRAEDTSRYWMQLWKMR